MTPATQLVPFLRARIRNGERVNMQLQCSLVAQETAAAAELAVAWQAALILESKRRVLTYSQTKLDKAAGKVPFVNRGLTRAPAMEARPYIGGGYNACAGATEACRAVCVGAKTGQGTLTSSQIARCGRSLAYHVDPARFLELYDAEVERARHAAARKGMRLAMRCNVATDDAAFAGASAARHPDVVHYDYTAITANMRRDDGVYRVYSLKDGPRRLKLARAMLDDGHGLAVVFAASARRKDPLPATWHGAPVIDGDLHDLWFLQRPVPGPFVVGLRVKGDRSQVAAAIEAGFAQPV